MKPLSAGQAMRVNVSNRTPDISYNLTGINRHILEHKIIQALPDKSQILMFLRLNKLYLILSYTALDHAKGHHSGFEEVSSSPVPNWWCCSEVS